MWDSNCGALRVEQILLAGTKTKFDEGSGVRKDFRLPVVIALKAGKSVARCLVPLAGSFAVEVVLADQRLLNLNGAVSADGLLATKLGLAGCGDVGFAVALAGAACSGR